MRIAIDAMGGDNAPQEIVSGAVKAAGEVSGELILVGDRGLIEDCLQRYGHPANVSIVHSSEIVGMDEKPVDALKKKKDASINVATRMVKEEKADAVISAGSTGAQMAAGLLLLGRLTSVQRPAIATILPGMNGPKLLLDAGANTDCRPEHLLDFAIMGSIYAESILGISSPSVGLLNIGTEPAKGNDLTRETFKLLKDSTLNFYGNLEARDLLTSSASVIVCDGFVGNSLLKFGEGVVNVFFDLMKGIMQESLLAKAGGVLLMSGLKNMQRKLDYQEYGGAPLLGVQGVSIVCHGSSKAKAIKNAVPVAAKCVSNNFVQCIADSMLKEKVKACQVE